MFWIDISNAEQGCDRSKFKITSGCSTPIIPITWLLIKISAHLFSRKRGSIFFKDNFFKIIIIKIK